MQGRKPLLVCANFSSRIKCLDFGPPLTAGILLNNLFRVISKHKQFHCQCCQKKVPFPIRFGLLPTSVFYFPQPHKVPLVSYLSLHFLHPRVTTLLIGSDCVQFVLRQSSGRHKPSQVSYYFLPVKN